MDLVCYSKTTQSSDFRIYSVLESLSDIRCIDVFSSLRELARRLFQAAYENTIIIFMAENDEELLEIFSISNIFRKFRTILVLPDQKPGTLKMGYLLEPRFISYMDSDFSDVRAIISQMCIYSNNGLFDDRSDMTPDPIGDGYGLGKEMRSGTDRRKFNDTILIGSDRRSDVERRNELVTYDGSPPYHTGRQRGDDMKNISGFTLMELIIVIALIGIAAAIAIPNFIGFLPNYRLKAAGQDLFSNFQKAKLTAVDRNVNTAVTFTGTGYDIYVDSNSDYDSSGEEMVIQVSWSDYKDISQGTVNFDNNGSGDPTIAFQPNGIPKDNVGTTASGDITLSNTNGKSLKVLVYQAGGIQIE